MSRIENIDEHIQYFDGVYTVKSKFSYMGYYIRDGFSWNGTTYWFTTKSMIKPTMIHDWLLYNGHSRDIADKVFKEAMELEGVSPFWINLVYFLVRLKKDEVGTYDYK